MPAPSRLIKPGAHHQLVADDLGVGGRFLERGDEELGGFHAARRRPAACACMREIEELHAPCTAGAIMNSVTEFGVRLCSTVKASGPTSASSCSTRRNQVFWGKRLRTHSWQFPQGGIKHGETPEQAMYRELHEEVGLKPEHVRIIARTRDWLRYEVPDHFIRRDARGHYRGPEADLVPAAADRPRQRHEPARHRPSGVRRLALERVLGAARRGDRVQARRLPDGADRTRALPAARQPSQPLSALGHAAASSRRTTIGADAHDGCSAAAASRPRRPRRRDAARSASTRSARAPGCRGGSARARSA